MKHIDEAVFLPVEKEDDPEQKAYISFHYFAKFLQSKGYAGVIYRSTRMDKIGHQGKNVVLFNPSDVEPVIGSMKVYHFDGKSYYVLKD